MAQQPTLSIAVKLVDLFSKAFKGVTQTIGQEGTRMATGLRATFNKIGSHISDLNKRFAGISTATKAVGAAIGIHFGIQTVRSIINTATQTQGLSLAMESLGKAVGIDAADAMKSLRAGTRGAVSDLDLMRLANNAMLLGVVKSKEEFGILAEAARRLGGAMGITATHGLESLVVGIGRQSKLWLDNLGIIVNTERAYEEFSNTLGKTTEELTDNERKAAFNAATYKAIGEKMKQLGPDTNLWANSIGKANATLENLWATFSKQVGPAIAQAAEDIAKWVKENKQAVTDLGKVVGALLSATLQYFNFLKFLGEGIVNVYANIYEAISKVSRLIDIMMTPAKLKLLLIILGRNIASDHLGFNIKTTKGPRALEDEETRREAKAEQKILKSYSAAVEAEKSAILAEYNRLRPQGHVGGTTIFGAPGEKHPGFGVPESPLGKLPELKGTEGLESLSEVAERYRTALSKAVQVRRDELRLIGETQTGVAQLWTAAQSGLLQYVEKGIAAFDYMVNTLTNTLDIFESTVSDVIFDGLMGKMKSFKEYMRSFLEDMAKMLSKVIAEMAMIGLVKAGVGAISSLFSVGASVGSGVGPLDMSNTNPGAGPMGFDRLSLNAEGGVANRPSIFGEAGPEAAVPLSRGRYIPVELKGGAGGMTLIYAPQIHAMDGPSAKRVLYEQRRDIVGFVKDALMGDAQLRSAVRAV